MEIRSSPEKIGSGGEFCTSGARRNEATRRWNDKRPRALRGRGHGMERQRRIGDRRRWWTRRDLDGCRLAQYVSARCSDFLKFPAREQRRWIASAVRTGTCVEFLLFPFFSFFFCADYFFVAEFAAGD